jgi:predicted metalloprotease with PDZ domain
VENQKLSHPHFLETLAPYLVEDPEPFFERHILQGEALPLQHLLDQLDLEYRMGAELFDLGFTFNAEHDRVLAVDSASIAFRTGVRKGDRVTSRAIYFGSIGQPVELTLQRAGRQIPVSYLPVRKAGIPQLENNPRNQVFFSK